MADRDKVFDALRNCVTEPKCKDCPWEDCEIVGHKKTEVSVTLLLDVLEMLREQEPVKPNRPGTGTYETVWSCGVCGYPMPEGAWCACPRCGRKVKWNA